MSYARDAFEGLRLMDATMARQRGGATAVDPAEEAARAERKARHERSRRIAAKRKAAEAATAGPLPGRSDVASDNPIPTPPFWGTRVVKGVAVADYAGHGRRARPVPRPVGAARGPRRRPARRTRSWSRPRAVRGCATGWSGCPPRACWRTPPSSTGTSRPSPRATSCVVLDEPKPDAPERHRLAFPRQRRDRHLCLADFWRPRELAVERGEVDVLPLHLVTMGQPIADYANELFAKDAYRDYLEVHGLGVQLTEALAEFWHRRIREELRFAEGAAVAAEDPADVREFFDLGYRGARYSLGYGACPNLDDRVKIVDLLQPERIGVTLSEELQLHPEQSTDAHGRPPPGGEVLQCRLSRGRTPSCGTWTARSSTPRSCGRSRCTTRRGGWAARCRPRRATPWSAATWPARSRRSSTTSACRGDPARMAEAERFIDDRTAELFAGGLPWRPGALEALRLVDGLGWPTALVTNTGRALAEAALDSIGREHFTVSVCADEVPFGKPDPDPYLRAAELLGVAPARCLAVEDSPNGALAAERAGAAVLVVPCDVPVPDGPGARAAAVTRRAHARRPAGQLRGGARPSAPRETAGRAGRSARLASGLLVGTDRSSRRTMDAGCSREPDARGPIGRDPSN